jgi:hypothetical protein
VTRQSLRSRQNQIRNHSEVVADPDAFDRFVEDAFAGLDPERRAAVFGSADQDAWLVIVNLLRRREPG